MGKRNKLVESMLIGAAIGAVVSLFDKDTRETVIQNGKAVSRKSAEIIKNPEVVTGKIKDNIRMVRSTINEITEDVQFLATKVNELNEKTPEMIGMIKETKDAFAKTITLEGEKNSKIEE